MSYQEPTIDKTAFSCPCCKALTTQYWHNVFVVPMTGNSLIPVIPDPVAFEASIRELSFSEEDKDSLIAWSRKMNTKRLFIEHEFHERNVAGLHNLWASRCFNCNEWAIWISDSLVYPPKTSGPPPNADLPTEIAAVVTEAQSIVELSPRGAAALLRLAIQMLCKQLGEPGKDLNTDIGSLVKKGLDPMVQKSFDIVRVIGNESVHPGEINLSDNRAVAMQLFTIINIIANQLITIPKSVEGLYSSLPKSKRDQIDGRDGKV